MVPLSSKKCIPCEGDMPALEKNTVIKLTRELNAEWQIVDFKKISREFKFKNFSATMLFVNKVADLAEAEGHHPDLHIFYNKVVVELWTHAVGGLSENDFILASKIDLIIPNPK